MIYAANFKMNHTRASTKNYLEELENLLEDFSLDAKDEIFIFPPATALLESSKKVTIGAQNAYPAKSGAFTGEIGLSQLEEFKIKTILIGHSERRELLKETQEEIAKKFDFFKKEDFKIIYCIGEPLSIREQGKEAVFEYLWRQFEGIQTEYENLIIAYEPIWAIGTGKSATIEDIDSVCKELKKKVSSPILYGGSVNSKNISSLKSLESVDGVLVGSASLEARSFFELISADAN
jgi:triosephosphate isomerase